MIQHVRISTREVSQPRAESASIKRRDFLKASAAAGLLACVGPRAGAVGSGPRGPRVIVIGAGFAGLAAAHRLIERGFDVTVIEAQDRAGGRAKTLHGFVDHPVELGCAWVNRRDPYVEDYLNRFRLKTIPDKWEWLLTQQAHGGGNYRILSKREHNDMWRVLRELNRKMSRLEEGSQETIGEIADQMGLNPVARNLIDAEISSDAAILPDQVGGYEWWYEADGIGPNKLLQDGMSALVEHLTGNLDIRLRHVVTGIDYSSSGATVHLRDQADMTARYVVVTAPLGVLKLPPGELGHIEFNPPLSAAKKKAIAAIPVGTFNKVMMRFTDNFWADVPNPYGNGEWSFLYQLNDHFDGPTLFNDASYGRKDAELAGGAAFHGLVCGEWGRSVEMNEQLVELMVSRMKGVFGAGTVEAHIPGGKALPPFHMMSWDDDPFARGCYSVAAVGTLPHRRQLGEPELGTLFFAGEAVGSNVPRGGFRTATVVAALGSGVDAANKIT